MGQRFVRYVAVVALIAAHAVGAADIRITDVELSFLERQRGGWVSSDEPAKGGMLAVTCTYELIAESDERPGEWFVAFIRDEQELGRARGGGLADPATGRAKRTWYGLIAAPGSYEVGCLADPDDQIAETDEGNNRLVRALSVPGEARGEMPRTPFVRATAGQAAAARGAIPAVDLEVTDTSGMRRAGEGRRGISEPLTSAMVGETLLVDCRFRVHVDSVNSEVVELPSWTMRIERAGAVAKEESGPRDLAHARGTTSLQGLVERWTPTEPGQYVFRCLLDPAGAVAEANRANNARELTVEIVPAKTPAATQAVQSSIPDLPPAQLGFVTYTHEPAIVMGPTEKTVYGHKGWYDKPNLKVQLMWDSPVASQFKWRWQAALWPFPASPSVEPQVLLAEGEVTGSTFIVDLSAFPPLGTLPKTGFEAPSGNASAAAGLATGGAGTGASQTGSTASIPVDSAAVPQSAAARVPGWAASSDARPMPDLTSRAGDAGTAGTRPQTAATALAQAAPPLPTMDFTEKPVDIYLRIVPVANGKPAGTPSNFVVAHYLPDVDPGTLAAAEHFKQQKEQQQELAEMAEAADVFDLALVSFEQAVFAESEKWGCVRIVKNPYYGKPTLAVNQGLAIGHPLTLYAEGAIVCPQKDEQYMEKSWDEQVWEGIKGYGHAWNGLAEVYDYVKTWVAKQWAENLPCEWLGDDLEDDCESAAEFVAKAAINVGLAAAGVPPTLPDLEALEEAAKGEVASAAVEATCDALESPSVTCTPEMRDALADLYSKGLNEMQKMATRQLSEPGCGDVEEAKAHGKNPLPCFTNFQGVEVEPAPGAIDAPPAMNVSLKRTKPDPEFHMDCNANAGMTFTKQNLPGLGTVSQALWMPGKSPVPALNVGQSAIVRIELGFAQHFKQLGQKGQSIDWWGLLPGSTASLSIGTTTAQAVAPGDGGPVNLRCSEDLQRTVQVPNQVTLPWGVL